MEQKTAEMINNICKLDSEVLPIVLLKHYETIAWLYHRFADDDGELEHCLESLNLNTVIYEIELKVYMGFETDDEIAGGFIHDYCFSEDEKRLDILKKNLFEWAIELEDAKK